MADSFLPPAVLDMIVNAAEWTSGLDEAAQPLEAINDLMAETSAAAGDMSAAVGTAADGMASAVSGAADAAAGSQEAIGASSEAMAGTVAASMGEVEAAITAAAEASALAGEPLAAYSEGLIAAAGSAGDLALAQAELKASSAEVKSAVADLSAVQLTAGKDSDEYAAQLNVVADAMLRQQDAAYQLRNAQIAAAGAAEEAGGAAEASAGQVAVLGDAQAVAGKKAAAAGDEQEAASGKAAGGLKLWGLAAVAGIAVSVKMAGDFQQSMTRLVTSAGESKKNLAMVSQGILSMSTATNTSTSQLAAGMYQVESAGFHGANGLKVLKAAAEGAQAEGADLGTVANAVTSGLNAYGLSASHATSFTNQMVTTVGQGKMTMQDLAGSLSAVLPIAAANKISYAQVGGALATMTSMGVSAKQGTQDLASTIRSLGNPTSVAVKEMGLFGISSTDIASKLGQRGLTGTIGYLADTVKNKMGPSGLVAFNAFNKSASAASDASIMLKKLPPSIQGVAKAYLAGTTSYNTWYAATKTLGLTARTLADQFATTAGTAHGFNSMLKAGNPAAQTFGAAMSKMLGGATGLNVGLMLTGNHASVFNKNVRAIADSAQHTGANINNWSLIQKNFNFQLGSAEKAIQAMAISFGTALLPAATTVMHALASFGTWLSAHTAACKTLAIIVGVLLAGALAHGLTSALKTAAGGFKDLYGGVKGAVGFFRGAEGETSQFGKIMGGLGSAAKSAGSVVSKAWSGTMSGLSSAWSGISGAASSAGTAVAKAWSSSMSAIGSALSSAWSGITSALSSAWSGITGMASSAGSAIASAWSSSMTAISGAASAAWSGIVSGLSSVGGALAGAASSVAEFAAGVASQLAEAAAATVAWIAEHTVAAGVFIAENTAMAASALAAFVIENAATLGIVAAIAIVIGAIVYLATHWKQTWHLICTVIDAAVGFIKSHWELIVSILLGPVGLALALIITHFNQIKHFVLSVIDSVIDFVRSHWKLIVSILGGPVVAAAVFVATHWHQIEDLFSRGVSAVIGFLEKLPGRIEHVFADAGSWLISAGKAVVEGLIHGIENMAGSAISTVTNLGGSLISGIGSALGIGSPSKEFARIGAMITAGLSLGITATSAAVLSKARTLGDDVIRAAAMGEITAAQAGELTARVAASLRAALRQAIGQALGSTLQAELAETGKITKASLAILVQIWDAAKGGLISRGEASGLAKWVKADNARLLDLAKKRTAIANEIAAAQSLASSTASATESSYNLSSAVGTGSAPASVSSIISTLKGDVAQIRRFASNIRKLARMGLNKAYLQQLISMGPASGGALAAELASSGLGDIKQINAAEAAITSASNQLGDAAVSAMYTAGKQSGAGFLQGLKDQEKAIEAVMAHIAAVLVKRIKKDLGISSPSKVFFAHGAAIAQGLALGIASGVGQVARAVGGLSAAASLAGTRSTAGAGVLSAGGVQPIIIQQHTTVEAMVGKQTLFTANKQETYRYNIRNSGGVTGIAKPGP